MTEMTPGSAMHVLCDRLNAVTTGRRKRGERKGVETRGEWKDGEEGKEREMGCGEGGGI